jgi:hypothetical protein
MCCEQVQESSFVRFLVDTPLAAEAPDAGSGGVRSTAEPQGHGTYHQQYWIDGARRHHPFSSCVLTPCRKVIPSCMLLCVPSTPASESPLMVIDMNTRVHPLRVHGAYNEARVHPPLHDARKDWWVDSQDGWWRWACWTCCRRVHSPLWVHAGM